MRLLRQLVISRDAEDRRRGVRRSARQRRSFLDTDYQPCRGSVDDVEVGLRCALMLSSGADRRRCGVRAFTALEEELSLGHTLPVFTPVRLTAPL